MDPWLNTITAQAEVLTGTSREDRHPQRPRQRVRQEAMNDYNVEPRAVLGLWANVEGLDSQG